MNKTLKTSLLLAILTISLQVKSDHLSCRPAFDSVSFLVDVSGSMMLPSPDTKSETYKIIKAKSLLKKLTESADPAVPLGIFTVGPFTVQQLPVVKKAEEIAKVIKEIPEDLESVGRMTWLGNRAKRFLSDDEHGAKAVVLVTDGGFTKWKEEEKVEVKKAFTDFKKACNGNRLFVISLASTHEEKARMNEVLGKEVLDMDLLLENRARYQSLIDELFRKECLEEILELKGINFDFDQSNITDDSNKILEQALEVIKKSPVNQTIRLRGWTDHIGSDSYNKNLSYQRAEAVKQWLVSRGIASERISVEGYGKSFKYDNGSAYGRWENRRTDLIFSD